MNRLQEEYDRVDKSLKLSHAHATFTMDGIYLMIDGELVGEQGLRWWVYKVISGIAYKRKKAEEG